MAGYIFNLTTATGEIKYIFSKHVVERHARTGRCEI